MVYLLVQHKVEDYDAWKPVFDDHARTREEHGCQGGTLFHAMGDPDDVTVLFEWDNWDNAEAFVASGDLKKKMREAGVTSEPEITYLEKIEDVKA